MTDTQRLLERTGGSLLRGLKLTLRLILGGVFLYAAYDKLLHPDRFAEILMDYEVLPHAAVNPAAVWLPMLELVIGLFVVVGVWIRANALLMSALTVIFITGIVVALGGGVDLHCGCFSTSPGGEARSWLSLWKELLLLAGCGLLWLAHWPEGTAGGEDKAAWRM